MEQVLLSFYRLDMSLLFSISISSHRRARKFLSLSLSLLFFSLFGATLSKKPFGCKNAILFM
jgi:hypothetical protein